MTDIYNIDNNFAYETNYGTNSLISDPIKRDREREREREML